MADILALCLTIVLFSVALIYVRGCDRLNGVRS